MKQFDRLPAFPIITQDPYFSVWMPADLPTEGDTCHWAGSPKPLRGTVTVDGKTYRWIGYGGMGPAQTEEIRVTALSTRFVYSAGGIELTVTFRSPLLPDDLDTLSTPISFADFSCRSLDGEKHSVRVSLDVFESFCYDGNVKPSLYRGSFSENGMNVSFTGKNDQPILHHSADHITIDWGYVFLATPDKLDRLIYSWELTAGAEAETSFLLIGYDDIASVNYFGVPCRAWYTRNGKTFRDALTDFYNRHEELVAACDAMDARVAADAMAAGGEDFVKIANAAYRQSFAAHKLIVTPKGEMAFLSKENDSNGCIGTVDVSYPSIPLFLKYCPELVNALSLPVLEYASMPVWDKDFAPHDVGRYPHALGQVYALKYDAPEGEVNPPLYLMPAGSDIFDDRWQMPVEESGNMLIMLATAVFFGADDSLAKKYLNVLNKWVRYLDEFGEDPGDQLCTDDFAGHFAHNVNLSAKAISGMACYARLLKHYGLEEDAARWDARARELADSWTARTAGEETPLTFDGIGWSMKYNLVWDRVLDLGLMPEGFYAKETAGYLPHINRYGLPLDSRADYTKADWECWCAAMAPDPAVRSAIFAPIARYLEESRTRVAFSDWYDTRTGGYQHFIARSVIGGVFMPLLVR